MRVAPFLHSYRVQTGIEFGSRQAAVAKGIRVNAVAPVRSDRPSSLPAGQPVELAPVQVFPASQEASYVTGEVYGATGGNGTA
ncbi:hypothetical protein GOFOIKOB_0333 [Methylobacterium tardum]|uniref:hypothetical protein n=1 Tax=Methylobacterium tardum TaxID=374432 RepID=UPI002087907C|nr:hypothetical protein GOFOIKOB_0333 [Methylobacterium tardum]